MANNPLPKNVNNNSPPKEKFTTLLTDLVTTYPEVMVVTLTLEEAKMARVSFMRISDRLEEIGTASFSELFTHHPEAIRIFVTNRVFPENITEVPYSWELKAHALRVMHMFEKIINRLDKPSTIWSAMIADVGCRHAAYNAKPAYLPVLVAAFRHSFFKEFTRVGILTPELANAWYKIFNNMTVLMTAAVVASFVDSYADHKQNPSVVPVWSVEPKKTALSTSPYYVPGGCQMSQSPPANGNPPKTKVSCQESQEVTGSRVVSANQKRSVAKTSEKVSEKDKKSSSNSANKCPYRTENANVERSPRPPSNSFEPAAADSSQKSGAKLKKRFSELLALPAKNALSKSRETSASISHSSSSEDVQIINI